MRVFGIGRVFRRSGHWVGTDKLGHFFMQGLDYFKRVHEDGQPLAQVFEFAHGEDGLWGRAATGVRSYADMAANAAGYRFWASLYRGPQAYLRCEEGKGWIKLRRFAWRDYVTDAWDEGINCSEMSDGLRQKVEARLGALGLQCPVDLTRCQRLALMDDARFVVNPKCLTGYVLPNFSKE